MILKNNPLSLDGIYLHDAIIENISEFEDGLCLRLDMCTHTTVTNAPGERLLLKFNDKHFVKTVTKIRRVCSDITAGIATKNNLAGLHCCLTALLSGEMLPGEILLRLDGESPGFNDYYFEQLACLARLKGVRFRIEVCEGQGVFLARHDLVASCHTSHMLFVDDDVVLGTYFLSNLVSFLETEVPFIGSVGWIQGTKGDVNNKRSYGNFVLRRQDWLKAAEQDRENFNWLWKLPDDPTFVWTYVKVVDAGAGLLLDCVSKPAFNSVTTPNQTIASGGEDTLYSAALRKAGFNIVYLPCAEGYHLEKPTLRITEHAYRKQAIFTAAQLLDLPIGRELSDRFLAWEGLIGDNSPEQIEVLRSKSLWLETIKKNISDTTRSRSRKKGGRRATKRGR